MNCSFAKSRISSYLDGELSGNEMLAMRGHTDACPACRARLSAETASKRLLSSLPEHDAPPELVNSVMAAIRGTAPAQPLVQQAAWPTGRMAIALAAAAVAMFCVFLLRDNDPVSQPVPGNEIAYDQDWNNARSVFPANNLPAGLDGP